jgi:VCBS repeat-containing protein
MKPLSRTLIALPVLLALAAAVRADDKPPETPYSPLKVGNSWTYRMGDTKYVLKVAAVEKVEEQSCFRMETTVGDKVVAFEDFAVKADGVYRYVADNKTAKPPVCLLKLPVKKDETWTVDSSIGTLGKITGTFKVGEVEEVKVPAGTYKNVVIVTANDLVAGGTKSKVTYYLAKDVGMIKQTIVIEGQEVVIELEKFDEAK